MYLSFISQRNADILGYSQAHLSSVQKAKDDVRVGVRPDHHSMGRDTGKVTVFILIDVNTRLLRTQQFEISRVQVEGPGICTIA